MTDNSRIMLVNGNDSSILDDKYPTPSHAFKSNESPSMRLKIANNIGIVNTDEI